MELKQRRSKQILRCHGRINNSSLPQTSENPILLPSSHPYVNLLICHTHKRVKHSAVTNTLTTLRESFWILKGRQSMKRVEALRDMPKTRRTSVLVVQFSRPPKLLSLGWSTIYTHWIRLCWTLIHPTRWKSRERKRLCVYSLVCPQELFTLSYYEV